MPQTSSKLVANKFVEAYLTGYFGGNGSEEYFVLMVLKTAVIFVSKTKPESNLFLILTCQRIWALGKKSYIIRQT
jgi:hypothetical protein